MFRIETIEYQIVTKKKRRKKKFNHFLRFTNKYSQDTREKKRTPDY